MINYERNYYERDENGVSHPAGYSSYGSNWRDFKTQNTDFIAAYGLSGNILELGGAYGFLAREIPCTSIDISEWACSQSEGRVTEEDALTYLPTVANNAFDTVVGLRFMPCLSDAEIALILPHILRVASR